jgi:hypothetical protein
METEAVSAAGAVFGGGKGVDGRAAGDAATGVATRVGNAGAGAGIAVMTFGAERAGAGEIASCVGTGWRGIVLTAGAETATTGVAFAGGVDDADFGTGTTVLETTSGLCGTVRIFDGTAVLTSGVAAGARDIAMAAGATAIGCAGVALCFGTGICAVISAFGAPLVTVGLAIGAVRTAGATRISGLATGSCAGARATFASGAGAAAIFVCACAFS